MYQLPLTGPAFEHDSALVWAIIQKASINSHVYEWLKKYDRAQDGRAAMLVLYDLAEGEMAWSKRVHWALRIVSLDTAQGGNVYTNEYNWSFLKYSTAIIQAFEVI